MKALATTLVVATAAVALFTAAGSAEISRTQACMEGNDTVKSTAFLSVYCGPASAVVTTKGTSTKPIKLGTCVKNLRGSGSFDLYLGTDKSGGGPWPRTLHLYKPKTGKAGLTMEEGFEQWAGLSTVKISLTANGGSFSGTVLYRVKGKNADPPYVPIKGTFKCGR